MSARLGALVRDRPVPLHPLLLAAFPVAFLWAANAEHQIPATSVAAALAAVLGGAAVLLMAGTVALGAPHRGALAASMWVLLFFSYGHVWEAVRDRMIGREPFLLGVWALLGLVAVVLASRAGPRLPRLTAALNVGSAVLVAANVVSGGLSAIGSEAAARTEPPVPLQTVSSRHAARPDIYYIVMDRYGARPTLQSLGVDNRSFLASLRRRGFYVAHRSTANYPKTAHSLAASLNMRYLGFLTEQAGRGSDDWNPVYRLLQGPRVARSLQAIGYRYVLIGSRWDPTRVDRTADLHLHSDTMSEFAQVLYETTLLGGVARHTDLLDPLDARARERARALFQFDALSRVSRMPESTFTFAHVLLPHEPYLFEADGSPVSEEEEMARTFEENFANQLRFANRKLDQVLDVLLAGPDRRDPVVILQADEGPHPRAYGRDPVGFRWPEASREELERKLRILNAYYLPGSSPTELYAGITPVNSFRLVFDRYFDADLELLPDRNIVFVDERHLYDFVEVTGRLSG